jgi:RNA polymerase sigma factor (sigma-70 family)
MVKEKAKDTVDTFFKREYKKLVNYVRKNMEQRFYDSSPEDIVQDVALGLLSAVNANTQIESVAAYVYRAVKNKIIDSGKKKQYTVSINDQLANGIAEIAADEHLLELGNKGISAKMLKNAFAELKPDEQALIIETELNGKTFDELSIKWDIPIGTLLSRKHRALAKLNKALTDK